jgi:hypothetical protein
MEYLVRLICLGSALFGLLSGNSMGQSPLVIQPAPNYLLTDQQAVEESSTPSEVAGKPMILPEESKPAPQPGEGISISMLNGTSQLKLFGSFSALTVFSTDRPFAPGLPLFLLPESPFGLNTNTFDIHARQSNIGASFSGPQAGAFTPSATLLAFIANDSLTGDSYGFLPYNAYGELKNEEWRFAAGLQNDVFTPRKPTSISLASMFTTGNTGSFRSQARLERNFGSSSTNSLQFQLAASDPVQSVIESRNARIEEDNGWPNVEARINAGLGPVEQYCGGRQARLFEIGVSSFVGQLRTTRSILSPPDPQSPIRQIADCWGLGIDSAINLTDSIGLQGELFTGAGLGEYNGGIGQTYDSAADRTIRSSGGWGEVFLYLTSKLHLHTGYGIDAPLRRTGDTFLLTENQTLYTNLVWNWTRNIQISNQVDFRRTNFRDPLLDADGAIFYSEFQWKF